MPDAGPARVRIDRHPVRWSAEERGILNDSERSKRLQNVYSARDNRELVSVRAIFLHWIASALAIRRAAHEGSSKDECWLHLAPEKKEQASFASSQTVIT